MRYVETRVRFKRLIQRKVKEKGSGFQFTSCERVAETYKMKRTKLNVNGRVWNCGAMLPRKELE